MPGNKRKSRDFDNVTPDSKRRKKAVNALFGIIAGAAHKAFDVVETYLRPKNENKSDNNMMLDFNFSVSDDDDDNDNENNDNAGVELESEGDRIATDEEDSDVDIFQLFVNQSRQEQSKSRMIRSNKSNKKANQLNNNRNSQPNKNVNKEKNNNKKSMDNNDNKKKVDIEQDKQDHFSRVVRLRPDSRRFNIKSLGIEFKIPGYTDDFPKDPKACTTKMIVIKPTEGKGSKYCSLSELSNTIETCQIADVGENKNKKYPAKAKQCKNEFVRTNKGE